MGRKPSQKAMPAKSKRKPAPKSKVVVSKAKPNLGRSNWSLSLHNPRFVAFVLVFVALGVYLLIRSFALTTTVTYSGSFTKKSHSASYSIPVTASGTLSAVATTSNVGSFQMQLISTNGQSVSATITGTNPETLTAPVTSGTYTLILSGQPLSSHGSGSYTVNVTYPIADTTPPTVGISSPANGSAVSGTITLTGTATDNDGVASVAVSIDAGAYTMATLTGSSAANENWTYALDTTKLSNASHTITAKATDLTGNTSTTTASYTVNNQAAASDTTAPTIGIDSPVSGATVNGTINLSGTANDNVSVAKVDYQIDSGAFTTATGTTSWNANLNTTALSNANHTITARATDTSGNQSTSSIAITVSNTTNSNTAPNTQGAWTSPEGVTIVVNTSAVNADTGQVWTIAQAYNMLKSLTVSNTAVSNDYLKLAPHYQVNIQDTYTSMTTTSYVVSGGVYSNFSAITYLQAPTGSTFAAWPDYVMAHEYGIAWSQFFWSMNHQADWTPYVNMRLDGTTYNGTTYQYLGQDPRLWSSLTWDPREIIGDDYRLLFGSPSSISERPFSVNSGIVDPRNQAGLANWLTTTWDGQ